MTFDAQNVAVKVLLQVFGVLQCINTQYVYRNADTNTFRTQVLSYQITDSKSITETLFKLLVF